MNILNDADPLQAIEESNTLFETNDMFLALSLVTDTLNVFFSIFLFPLLTLPGRGYRFRGLEGGG